MSITEMIDNKIKRAKVEAPNADIMKLILTIESTTTAIATATERGISSVDEAAELDMNQKLRQIARDEIARRA